MAYRLRSGWGDFASGALRIAVASVVLSAGVFASRDAHAFVSPLSLSIIQNIEFPPEDFTIMGVGISALWGEYRSVYGLDFGVLGNITEQNFGGIAVSGVFNSTNGVATIVGLQAAGFINVNRGKVFLYGLQVAPVNYDKGETKGIGVMAAPIANIGPDTALAGLQIGIYNSAHDIYGFQIGLVNYAENLHGLQIGLLNFNHNGPFAVSPILNVAF